MSETDLQSSSVFIDILIIIDTEYVKSRYPNPSRDPNNPTGIDHSSQFMIASGTRGIISGQGTADLNFRANPADNVAFRGISVYQNSDDAVIVYDIHYWSGNQVFNHFGLNVVRRNNAIMSDPSSPNGMPPIKAPLNFASLDSKVARSGTENFYVRFGLYTLSDDGETQQLFGYYYWDPTITVS